MKLFNIISESKSFLLLLLFAFTLVTTTQSFASSKNDDEDLAKLCGKDADLTKLEGEKKEKCVKWCGDKANWHEKCDTALGVKQPAGGNDNPNEMKTDGATNALSTLTDDDAKKIAHPAEIKDIYKVDFTIGKDLREKFLKLYKPAATTAAASTTAKPSTLQAKDLYNLENQDVAAGILKAVAGTAVAGTATDAANAIDKVALAKDLKGYITTVPADLTKAKPIEKALDAFRTKWLKLDAKGSVDAPVADFEPFAFKTLAAAIDHPNQGPAHKIYQLFTEAEQVFKPTDKTVEKDKVAPELKKLQDAILKFLTVNLSVTVPDKWAPNTDLTFSVALSQAGVKQSEILDMDVTKFDPNKKEDFDKIKAIFTPITFGAIDGINDTVMKNMAAHGLVILGGGMLDPAINPDETDVSKQKIVGDALTTVSYKVNAKRLKNLEMAIRAKVLDAPAIAAGAGYVDGSLLHQITAAVRAPGNLGMAPAPSGAGAFNQSLAANLVTLHDKVDANAVVADNALNLRTVFKVGNVNNKWVVLVSSVNVANARNLVGWLTQAVAAGSTEPRFLLDPNAIGKSPTAANTGFTDTTHAFTTVAGNGIETASADMFLDANAVTDTAILSGNAGQIHTLAANMGLDGARFVKFRLRAPHGLAAGRATAALVVANDPMKLLATLNAFKPAFISATLFGTDHIKTFAELKKMSPAIAQLYVYNKLTSTVMIADEKIAYLNPGGAVDLVANANAAGARHYLSTHVVTVQTAPNDTDASFLLTSRISRS